MADNMQNQAMERLRQMYSKAQTPQSSVVNTAPVNQKSRNEPQRTEQMKETKEQAQTPEKEVMHPKKRDSIAELFLKDKEKSLILLLIVLLISEKAESSVVLALLYLIL